MNIKFYESSSQRSPVTDFIDKQSKNDQAAIIAILTDIQDNGFNAKGCKFRQLKGKLWEIKIKLPSGEYRFLYMTIEGETIFIVHAFKKKSQKTPQKEITTALKRLREIL